MKRCEDCTHVRTTVYESMGDPLVHYHCNVVRKKYTSLIAREHDSNDMLYCSDARKDKRCGLAAKLFEMRPPREDTTLWQDIKSLFKKES